MRRMCVACSGEHPIETFKLEDAEFIEVFLNYIPFCLYHTDKLEEILKEKEES